MPGENNIPTPAPSAEPAAPPTTVDNIGGLPASYGDYLTQQTLIKQPKFQLPLPERYELLTPSEQYVYEVSSAVGKMFEKVSQPDFLSFSNTVADIHSDKIMQLTSLSPSLEDDPKLDVTKLKELQAQEAGEKATTIKDWSEMLGKTVPNGTIIRVDKYFKEKDRLFMRRLKELNPTWTGEYLQMQSTSDGTIVPKAYNMAVAFRNDASALSQELPGITVMAARQPEPEKLQAWIKEQTKDSRLKLSAMMPVERMEYEKDHPDIASLSPADQEKFYNRFDATEKIDYVLSNNQKLASLLYQNPELFKAFKEEIDKAPGGDIRNEFGQAEVFGRALDKAFDLNKPVDPVAYDTVSTINALRNSEYAFKKTQDELAAKMKIAGENALRNSGLGDKLNKYNFLQTQMLINPASITADQQKLYAALTLELNDSISKAGSQSLAQDWAQYQNNNKLFGQMLKAVPLLLKDTLSLRGSAGLDSMLKQQKGIYLANSMQQFFPEVAAADANQAALDKEGKDRLSMLKSLYGGIVEGVQTAVLGLAQLSGGDKGSFEAAGWLSNKGAFQYSRLTQTPNRPTNTGNYLTDFANSISNFSDQAAKQIGYMAMPIVLAPVGGPAAELAPFALQSYYDTQLHLRNAGVPDNDAEMIGLVNAGLTAITMRLAFMPSRLMRSQMEKAGVGELLDAFAGQKPFKQAVVEYLTKFAPTSTDVKNTYMAMAQQLSMSLAEYFENKGLNASYGTELPTTQFEAGNVFKNAAMMGAVTYALGTVSRLGDRSASRHLAVRYADENPAMFATAMDNAKQEALASGRYDITKLHELEDAVATYYQRAYHMPKNLSKDQQLAANHLLDNISYLKTQFATADENFKPILEKKIQANQAQLEKISQDSEAAIKYNNDITEPAKDVLAKIYPEEKVPEFGGVLVRHAQTDANITGKLNLPDEPLNAQGKQEAKRLGEELKGQGVTQIVSSPMERSRETAELSGLPYSVNGNLREWNTGKEGGFEADFDAKYYVEHPDEKPDSGESFNDFLGRVQQARQDVSRMTPETAVVTHGKVMKLWESLDKSGGKWDEKAKIEFLKDSNDFENNEIYKSKGAIATKQKSTANEIKPEKQKDSGSAKGAEKEAAPSKMPFEEYKEHMMGMLEGMKDSEFDWRVTEATISQKDREKGVADIRAGKKSAAASKVEKLIKDTYDSGKITVNRGRGNQAQTVDFSLEEWFGPYKDPVSPEEVVKIDQIADNAIDIIKRDGITLENIDNLKHLFDGFPYTKEDLADVKDYLKRQSESAARNKELSERGEKTKAIEKLAKEAPESEQSYYEARKKLVDKYGKDVNELIDELKKEGRLKVDCPPGTKRKFNLRNLLKRNA